MNSNVKIPSNDSCEWIVTNKDDKSQLDQGSGSTLTSDKLLTHYHVIFSSNSRIF